jgi:hypothetical protein
MRDTSLHESVIEKKCPLCGRGLARTQGPEMPCVLCVRLGPPSTRSKQPTNRYRSPLLTEELATTRTQQGEK